MGPYVRAVIQIIVDMRWFALIMCINILAAWNGFIMLTKRGCSADALEDECELARDNGSAGRTLFDMFNMLVLGAFDVSSFESSDFYGLLLAIFVACMIMVTDLAKCHQNF